MQCVKDACVYLLLILSVVGVPLISACTGYTGPEQQKVSSTSKVDAGKARVERFTLPTGEVCIWAESAMYQAGGLSCDHSGAKQ